MFDRIFEIIEEGANLINAANVDARRALRIMRAINLGADRRRAARTIGFVAGLSMVLIREMTDEQQRIEAARCMTLGLSVQHKKGSQLGVDISDADRKDLAAHMMLDLFRGVLH